jgi:uncharacterized OB-fold protein
VSEPQLGPKAQFDAYLAEGRFMLQRSTRTGAFSYYPRLFPPGDAGAALEWVPASGRGTVHAVTVTRRRPDQGGDYAIALVELAEGPRIMSTVVGIPPGDVRIGMAVSARVTERNGVMAVVFQTAKQ